MKTEPEFHPGRSAALRQMLVEAPNSTRTRHTPDRTQRSVLRRSTPYVVGATVAAGIAVAAASSSVPVSEEASDIVPSMSQEQTSSDMLPTPVASHITGTGADPDSTRFVGAYKDLDYYAAASDNGKICLIAVGPVETIAGWSMGCTKVLGFEGSGLRLQAQNGSIEAWLWAPQVPLTDEQKANWISISPHLLIRTD